jgi:large subunit ribosomal protein L27
MGRDHTIFAMAPGYVRFYTEKWMRKTRRFVGLVLERGEKLPRDEATTGRSRHFGLIDLNLHKQLEEEQKVAEAQQRRLGI